MQKQQYSTHINAPREKVWLTLWTDASFRDWANNVDEGTYMVGELKEGAKVQFISSINGYGVTSLVEKLVPNEYMLFQQLADTKDSGKSDRDKEWTGGAESYTLVEKDGGTLLTIELDVPPEQEETFQNVMPKAVQRIKELAEETV